MQSVPEEFIKQLQLLGHPAYQRIPEVIAAGDVPVSIRLNPRKRAKTPFGDAQPTVWNADGFYLSERPEFTLDPRLHQGLYYVQEASSMAVRCALDRAKELIGEHDGPLALLDACAAPGGKTTAAADAVAADIFVVANEFDTRRCHVLTENLAKWGVEAFVTNGDAGRLKFPDGFFDVVLVDAPCSGEGMMRKDPFAIEQWSVRLVGECAARQRDIVDNLWRAVADGGFMIYSTCTFNLSENEEIVRHVIDDLGGEAVEIPVPGGSGVLAAMGGYDFPVCRFVPGEVRGEGLFMAMLRKPGSRKMRKLSKPRIKPLKCALPFRVSDILRGDYTLVSDSPLRVVRTAHLPFYETMAKSLKPVSAGLELGEMKGRDFIPSQQLALSPQLVRGRFTEVAIDLETALRYLRREAIVLPDGAPRGLVLLTYDGHPLGWAKNLGNRANNLYPDAWRIRHL